MNENEDTRPPAASGVYAALATPRRMTLMEADAAALLDYLDIVVQTGVDGLVLFGSTGEFIHYDNEERMRVLALAIRRSRVPVLVNVSHSTLEGAVQLAENAAGVGAAGVLIMPPYYYRYADHQLQSFFESFVKEVADNDTPRYLYNIPSCTNAISPELAGQLLSSGLFAGIKDSSGDAAMLEALISFKSKRQFSLLLGHEGLHLQSRLAGADGIISGVAAAIPELPVAIDRAIRGGKTADAKHLNARMAEFLEWIDKFPGTVAIKQCAGHRGWPLNHFAFPLGERTEADLAAFRHWLDGWLPIVLAECA